MRSRKWMQPLYRRLHAQALKGLGYSNTDPSKNGELALLARLAERWREPILVDAGAFEGDWTAAALRIAPDATVHSLEPNPVTFERLERRLGAAAKLHNIALGSERGIAHLFAPPGLPSQGSLHLRDLSRTGLPEPESIGEVEVVSLDEFCAAEGIDRVDLLKLDLEGHEIAALDGASGLLRDGRIEVVQFEFGGTNIDSRTYLRDFFDRLGRTHRISRILSDGLEPIDYSEEREIFAYSNFAAVRLDEGG